MISRWTGFIQSNKWSFPIWIFCFVCSLVLFNFVLQHIENYPGIVFPDPLFELYEAKEYSLLLFLFTYTSLFTYLIYHRNQPEKWLLYLKAYTLLILMRTACVFLLPLEAPVGAIPLKDPILNSVFYPDGYSARDLFFSGHFATILLFAFFSETKRLKIFFYFSSIAVAVLLLLQKVHFSIDILAAPLFAVVINRIVNPKWFE